MAVSSLMTSHPPEIAPVEDGTTIHCWSWIHIQQNPKIIHQNIQHHPSISNIFTKQKIPASRLTRPTAILPILPGFMYLSQYLAARSGSGPKHLGKTSTCWGSEAGNSPVSRLQDRSEDHPSMCIKCWILVIVHHVRSHHPSHHG